MKILKFGGSSLSSAQGLHGLLQIVEERIAKGSKVLVVVSALADATDQLLLMGQLAASGDQNTLQRLREFEKQHYSLIEKTFPPGRETTVKKQIDDLLAKLKDLLQNVLDSQDASKKTLDLVLSFGERLSSSIVTEFLKSQIPSCALIDARDYIRTDSNFGSARVQAGTTKELITKNFPETNTITVIPGFIASTSEGETTTLGRGGSDYTASLFAAALHCGEIEVWTTVNGIMTADPLKVPRALTIQSLTYEEAIELGHFGAEIICAPALQPARDQNIPIRIRNFLQPVLPGSTIGSLPPSDDFPITGISSISAIALFRLQGSGLVGISGTASRLFDALSAAEINVTLISQASSEHSICFAIDPESQKRAGNAVENEFAFEIENRQAELIYPEEEHSIIAVVGANMRHRRGVAGKLFQALGKNGINIVAIAQGSSELNISLVIKRSDETKALNSLHDAFFLSQKKAIHLFCLGTGKVAQALLEQIAQQSESLAKRHIELRVVGLGNSRRMVFSAEGITLGKWQEALEGSSSLPYQIQQFVREMHLLNLPNSVFVDSTASEEVATEYASILDLSISIVTPNKRANSGSYARYQDLKFRAARANVKFFYETNVGAGLPIIGTLNDLISSGDEVLRIEAVLSGTLSFIFNSLTQGVSFSSIVKKAQELGFTEPDPRDDLSGKDVARKLLILAREIGMPLEESAVKVHSLVPKSCESAATVADFYAKLVLEDGAFEKIRADASAQGKILRYIGKIEKGKAEVSLVPVGAEHPFFSLSGSDNIVSFTTKRYFDRPLVVKGPGAGTDVTAAGVLADILRVTSYLA